MISNIQDVILLNKVETNREPNKTLKPLIFTTMSSEQEWIPLKRRILCNQLQNSEKNNIVDRSR